MQHMGLETPPPFHAHMSYVGSWNERFAQDGGEVPSGAR